MAETPGKPSSVQQAVEPVYGAAIDKKPFSIFESSVCQGPR
jgi:hypothetical protein